MPIDSGVRAFFGRSSYLAESENAGSDRMFCSNRNIGCRKFEDEARTDGGIVFDTNTSAVLGDDAGGDSETESCAAVFGGEVREEDVVLVSGRDAMAGVCDNDFNRVQVNSGAGF